jgi:transposase
MIIRMENAESLSLAKMEALLETSQEVQFAGKGRREVYEWVEQVLVGQEYLQQGRKAKGVLRAYLAKMTGRSLPQITRLVRQYRKTGQARAREYRRRRFARVYTAADVRLLAKVDRAHEGLSGPATRRILEREAVEYGHREYWSPWPWLVLVVKHKIAVLGRQKGPPSDFPISGSLFDWKMLSSASCICKSENGRISNVARSFRLS